ncbi:MAG: galactokinase, partial [Oscillospiraceae bacterium]|nr:galactokinase [Oscillospiraceae bacterium]
MATQPILATLDLLYKEEAIESQKKRYEKAISSYKEYFASNGESIRIFSAPGRTEVGGNHTDHNCGKVLAAGVDMDIIAVVEPIDEPIAVVKSEGFDESWILLEELDVVESEKNTTNALIRGVAKGFKNKGMKIGGFKAYATSNVLKGSGLSSSAAFEVLIGTIF